MSNERISPLERARRVARQKGWKPLTAKEKAEIDELVRTFTNLNWWDTFSIRISLSDYNIRIIQPDMEVMRTLAKMEINEAQEHYDPSDHVIISQAITMKLPLISSDEKFPFYRRQGLELIENWRITNVEWRMLSCRLRRWWIEN